MTCEGLGITGISCLVPRVSSASSQNHVFKMAEHDLTARMGCFLDRHLVFPLLEFLSVKEVKFYSIAISSFCDSLGTSHDEMN